MGVKPGQYEAFPPCRLGLQGFGAGTDSCRRFWLCDVRPILRSAGRGLQSRTRDSRLSGPSCRRRESKSSKCDIWKKKKSAEGTCECEIPCVIVK